MKNIEQWPSTDKESHQKRDELSRLCTELGVPQDMWLSERAIYAINLLLKKLKK